MTAVWQVAITAASTLAAAVLGGWLTIRAQNRSWQRDQDRHERDRRQAHYEAFIGAVRAYAAYLQSPTTEVVAVPRQRPPHDLLPHFGSPEGIEHTERLDTAKTALRLVASESVVEASRAVVRQARGLAAARATHTVDQMPADQWDALWDDLNAFIRAARAEADRSSTQ